MELNEMIGKEVETPAGEYVGMAESVKYITPDGTFYRVNPGCDHVAVIMVRHLKGDMALCAYEAAEVRACEGGEGAAVTWGPVAEAFQSVLLALSGAPATWDHLMGELAQEDLGQYRLAMAIRASDHVQAGW